MIRINVPARPFATVKRIPWASPPNLEGKKPIVKLRPRVENRTKLFRRAFDRVMDSGSFLLEWYVQVKEMGNLNSGLNLNTTWMKAKTCMTRI